MTAPEKPVRFGSAKTDHMIVSDFTPEKGWGPLVISKLDDFKVPPSGVVFHYGQQIFEGMKAYRSPKDEILLFRPDQNAARFHRSAERLAMAPVPIPMFLDAVKMIVKAEQKFVPNAPGALYIRPFLVPLDQGVSYRASESYRFCVIVSPVSSYYDASSDGITVSVEREYARAFPGGVGDIKCGGNYAGALRAVAKAKAKGAVDALWLDAMEHRYVEEVGTMNLMFHYEGVLKTPSLTGTILPGVTRNSVMQIAHKMGLEVREERIEIAQVLNDAESGALKEVFGCGTAVTVCPIQTIMDGPRKVRLDTNEDSLANRIREELLGIQTGTREDTFGWRVTVMEAGRLKLVG